MWYLRFSRRYVSQPICFPALELFFLSVIELLCFWNVFYFSGISYRVWFKVGEFQVNYFIAFAFSALRSDFSWLVFQSLSLVVSVLLLFIGLFGFSLWGVVFCHASARVRFISQPGYFGSFFNKVWLCCHLSVSQSWFQSRPDTLLVWPILLQIVHIITFWFHVKWLQTVVLFIWPVVRAGCFVLWTREMFALICS